MSNNCLYQDWTDDLRGAELASLQGVQPGAWLEMAAGLTRTDKASAVRIRHPANGDEVQYLAADTPSQKLAVRLFRYLSSEQLFALLLSGQRYMPFARFNRKIRSDQLNLCYAAIAQGTIPDGYERIYGRLYNFEEWLSVKSSGDPAPLICNTLVQYLRNEADFVSDRKFVNAIKHGRAQPGNPISAVSVRLQAGEDWIDVLSDKEMIWIEDWNRSLENDRAAFSHTHACESFDLRSDVGVLYINALLSEAILGMRKATLQMLLSGAKAARADLTLPSDIGCSNEVTRFSGLPTRGRLESANE